MAAMSKLVFKKLKINENRIQHVRFLHLSNNRRNEVLTAAELTSRMADGPYLAVWRSGNVVRRMIEVALR